MALKSLSTAERYTLLKHNKQPSSSHIYSVTLIGKYRRRFGQSWLNQYRWIVYSNKCDVVFCVFCALLGDNHSRATMGSFVNEPFRSWNKMNEKCDEHEHSKFHQTSLFCAKQCIALRGDIETTSTCTNPGNFLSILKLMSKHNNVLKIISNMHSSHILVWGLKATCYFSSVANERGTLESTEPNFAPPQYKTWLRAWYGL